MKNRPETLFPSMLQRAEAALQASRWDEAEPLLERLLAHQPAHPRACLLMGRMALAADYPEDSVELAECALAAHPSDLDLWDLLYTALSRTHGTRAAAAKLVAHGEHSGQLQYAANLAPAYLQQGRAAEALTILRRLLANDARQPLLVGLTATAWQMLGRPDRCRDLVRRKLELLPRDAATCSQWIGLHAGDPATDADGLARLARTWDCVCGHPGDPLPAPPRPGPHDMDGITHIGFLSTTFFHHSNCHFLLPLLEAMNNGKFRLFAYHDHSHEDAVTHRCRKAVARFRNVAGKPAREVAALMRADALDILVDINAHFDNQRLKILSYRPAPVQVHYLGGTGPSGLSVMDWRLADDLTEPAADARADAPVQEKIHRLAGGMHAFRPLNQPAEVTPPPALRNGYITFGSLNALIKMERPVLRAWGQILQEVPNSRLRLIKDVFRHAPNSAHFRRHAQKNGIPGERLDLHAPASGTLDDLSVYQDIDIALDTFPYNGITTTCEALWMGVPVVALRGRRFVAREAAAILTRIGCADWVADSVPDYIARAAAKAAHTDNLAKLRTDLRRRFQHSPVADANRLAHEMERFFQQAKIMLHPPGF